MKKSLLISLILLSFTLSQAQEAPQRRTGSLAFGGQGTQAIGQFGTFYSGIPVGLSGNLSIPVKHSPFELGGLFAWNNMGSDEEQVSVPIGKDETGDDIYGHGTMRVRSNIRRYHIFARLRPFTGKFQVYADAFAGVQTFSTGTDIEMDNSGYSSVTDSRVSERDLTANYGWAAGVRIRLARSVYVDGRFEKIEGGKATYVDPESINVNDRGNDITYNTQESRTNQLTYQIGLAIQF